MRQVMTMAKDKDPRDEETEPRVRVVDKRRLKEDDPAPGSEVETKSSAPESSSAQAGTEAKAEATAEPADSERIEDQSQEAEQEREVVQLAIRDLVRIFIAELSMRAWIHMGLIANPTNNLIVKDLPQARLAIDCVAALFEKIAPSLTPAERDELQRMLTDLRLNFVQQSSA